MTPHYADEWLSIYEGDCRDVLRELPADSVDCVVTSPPYWGLRDYGTATWIGGDAEHEHVGTELRTADSGGPKQQTKRGSIGVRSGDCSCGAQRIDRQLGLERTPEEYVANMVAVFAEVRRVLKPSGTCWLNLGDSYASGGENRNGKGGSGLNSNPAADVPMKAVTRGLAAGLKPKDLVGIPWRVAFALQADGWYLRSDIVWSKPNPMPESVTDRPTKSHEYLFLLTKSARYYFDADAVRERAIEGTDLGLLRGRSHDGPNADGKRVAWHAPSIGKRQAEGIDSRNGNPSGQRNIRSVWTIATRPYPGAHFAVFPPELPERCIKAGSSEKGVCPECGAPWERLTEFVAPDGRSEIRGGTSKGSESLIGDNMIDHGVRGAWNSGGVVLARKPVGWRPTCAHDAQPAPAVVLDPFGGSGTVGMVANRLSRRAILIDLNPEYLRQQMQRNAQTPLGLDAA